jgi:predicted TIM-barrel fold metal-dependent hydrolase
MPMHSKVKEAVETVGIDRVMFGSDAPFGHPSFEIRKIEVSGLGSDLVEKVLGENARRLFNIDTLH